MTLLDAFLAVIGAIWAIISAPITVLLYGIVSIFMGGTIVAVGFTPEGYGEFPVWVRTIYWLIGLAITVLGVSILVWVGASSDNPFFWRAS